MTTSNNHVSRRMVLRGLGGISLGLPLLESFTQPVSAQDKPAPQFLLVLNTQNGVRQAARGESETFWLRKSGPLTSAAMANESDRSLSVLSPYANDITIIKGLKFAFNPTGDGAHHSNSSQVLTGSKVKVVGGIGARPRSHPTHMSVDQHIAKHLNPQGVGSMNAIAADAKAHYLSFDEDGDIRSAQDNPLRLFEQVVGNTSANTGSAGALNTRRKFLNDKLRNQFETLEKSTSLSSGDKLKLEAHRSLIQDLEVKLCRLDDEDLKSKLDGAGEWFSKDDRRMEVAELHLQVMTLAVACGHTYAGTLQVGTLFGRGVTMHVGGKKVTKFHSVSHRSEEGGNKDRETHRLIDIMVFERLYMPMLGLLKERGLLNQGMAMWVNQAKDGMHGRDNVPYIIGGNAGGYLKTGLQVDAKAENDHLLNTIINASGTRKPDGSIYDDFGNKGRAKGTVKAIEA